MPHVIIDRRLNGKNKSSVNRQKFLRRVKQQTKDAVKQIIQDGDIKDIVSDKRNKINVPIKDINEPIFRHGPGGIIERVHPGNKEFIKGDRIPREEQGGGGRGGRGASAGGGGDDDFTFSISREEFLELFFEDLELPDLIKTNLATITEYVNRRAGFVTDGTPSRLNILRSMKVAFSRKKALKGPKKKKIKELEALLESLNLQLTEAQKKTPVIEEDVTSLNEQINRVAEELEVLYKKLSKIPFIDEMDLRYHNYVKVPVPTTQAVMFCIMDVSGSMTEFMKEMAKRFFMLLYLFLTKNYERIELVFIRHHSEADIVDEQEFFYSRETGGTVVSPALKLMRQKIEDTYNTSQWNIYGCQASDGDNHPNDDAETRKVLEQEILPLVQYFAYIEVADEHMARNSVTGLSQAYDGLANTHKNFNMVSINKPSDIYPVFRKLFEKKD